MGRIATVKDQAVHSQSLPVALLLQGGPSRTITIHSIARSARSGTDCGILQPMAWPFVLVFVILLSLASRSRSPHLRSSLVASSP
jgi:hypothetical protein